MVPGDTAGEECSRDSILAVASEPGGGGESGKEGAGRGEASLTWESIASTRPNSCVSCFPLLWLPQMMCADPRCPRPLPLLSAPVPLSPPGPPLYLSHLSLHPSHSLPDTSGQKRAQRPPLPPLFY